MRVPSVSWRVRLGASGETYRQSFVHVYCAMYQVESFSCLEWVKASRLTCLMSLELGGTSARRARFDYTSVPWLFVIYVFFFFFRISGASRERTRGEALQERFHHGPYLLDQGQHGELCYAAITSAEYRVLAIHT